MGIIGYDMEDAMIINKSSWERGFMHGFLYKTTDITLPATGTNEVCYFTTLRPGTEQVAVDDEITNFLDEDGLP